MGEAIMSALAARRFLGELYGCKEIHASTLAKLIKEAGLPAHPDPFGRPNPVFLRSELLAWWERRLNPEGWDAPKPLKRGPGRPRKPFNARRP